ncbi:MAG: cell division protein SepF [Tissierellia bacterium]|nr:cell division protein SepF [Tissierellia bacterium]
MNSFGDKVKFFFGLEEEENEASEEPRRDTRGERRAQPESEYVPSERRERRQPARSYPERSERERAYNTQAQQRSFAPEYSASDAKMIICKYAPIDHRESTSIIDDIKLGRPVILNFEETEDYVSAKIINICEGAAYALDADISKIANAIYIIVPHGVDVHSNAQRAPIVKEELPGIL